MCGGKCVQSGVWWGPCEGLPPALPLLTRPLCVCPGPTPSSSAGQLLTLHGTIASLQSSVRQLEQELAAERHSSVERSRAAEAARCTREDQLRDSVVQASRCVWGGGGTFWKVDVFSQLPTFAYA